MLDAFFTAILFSLFLHPTTSEFSQLDDEDAIIYWSSSQKLTWEDFLGSPPGESDNAAQSWVGIEFFGKCIDGKFTFEVMAIFNKDSSWSRLKKPRKEVLRHEQAHFDIAGIYACHLTDALNAMPKPCLDLEETKKVIDELTSTNNKELSDEQKRYDRETEHGTDKKMQKLWQKKISELLGKVNENEKDRSIQR